MFYNDERYIKKRFGTANHFKVPEGYFDTFTSRVMDGIHSSGLRPAAIPHAKEVGISSWKRYRKAVVGIAATACVALLSLGAYLHGMDGDRPNISTASHAETAQSSTYSSFDAMMDYTMMDTDDMYAYMSDLN